MYLFQSFPPPTLQLQGVDENRRRLVVPALATEELAVLVSKFLTRQDSSEKIFFDILLAEGDNGDNIRYIASKMRSECERIASVAASNNVELKANKERYKQAVAEMKNLKTDNALLREKITSLENMFVNFDVAHSGGSESGGGDNSYNDNNNSPQKNTICSAKSGNQSNASTNGQKEVVLSGNTDEANRYEQLLINGSYFLVHKKRRIRNKTSKRIFMHFTYDLKTLVWKKKQDDPNIKGSRQCSLLTGILNDNSIITLVGADKADSITLEATDDTDMSLWERAFAFALTKND